jgi:hypothetical protein
MVEISGLRASVNSETWFISLLSVSETRASRSVFGRQCVRFGLTKLEPIDRCS